MTEENDSFSDIGSGTAANCRGFVGILFPFIVLWWQSVPPLPPLPLPARFISLLLSSSRQPNPTKSIRVRTFNYWFGGPPGHIVSTVEEIRRNEVVFYS